MCAALALVYAGCGGSTVPEEAVGLEEPPDGTDASMVIGLLREPAPVPAFSVTDLDGQTLSSTDWLGKVVFVNFWATWCGPCLAEIPDLIALQEKYRDRLLIVGVSEDELPPEAVKAFAIDRKINYPIVMLTPEISKTFPGVVSLPTTFMLDREGRMARKQVGLLNGQLAEAVTRALAGLSVNAKIERVDDPGRLTAESAAQVKEIPGIDLKTIPADRRIEALLALNDAKCTCGCDFSVAKCRIDDPDCPFSLPLAQTIAEKFASAP